MVTVILSALSHSPCAEVTWLGPDKAIDVAGYIYIYIYIYIYREREREKDKYTYTHVYIYIYIIQERPYLLGSLERVEEHGLSKERRSQCTSIEARHRAKQPTNQLRPQWRRPSWRDQARMVEKRVGETPNVCSCNDSCNHVTCQPPSPATSRSLDKLARACFGRVASMREALRSIFKLRISKCWVRVKQTLKRRRWIVLVHRLIS